MVMKVTPVPLWIWELWKGNPHSVIEGMIIAAIKADEGYVYVGAEYPLAVKRIRKAIKDAYTLGLLGKHVYVLGSKFTFNLNVMECRRLCVRW
ncbi:MAG: hypothetical protein MZV70_58220 [Desulfobacterales bacterium]|nr:hypothetical protein [Desulfobacterales bacterium]